MQAKKQSQQEWQSEIEKGQRFEFGQNWAKFIGVLTEERIQEAEDDLKKMLEVNDLQGKSFLDVGSGSGLSSLAAKRLGARVVSFDYDAASVACTRALKQRYFPTDLTWSIQSGSILDPSFLQDLGTFDIVYAWGVLHHTGDMWTALKNIDQLVAEAGHLFISLYNDQGLPSKLWWWTKKAYVSLPAVLRFVVLIPCVMRLWGIRMCIDSIKNFNPLYTWNHYKKNRGMSPWYDVMDWVGGFPFEVSTPDQIFNFYKACDYKLRMLKTCGGRHGCNQYVFEKQSKKISQ